MLSPRVLIAMGLFSISLNACNLLAKNAGANSLSQANGNSSVVRPTLGRYVCLDNFFKPIGIEFYITPNDTYRTKEGQTGKLIYSRITNGQNGVSVNWTGVMKIWNESFYTEINKGDGAFSLLGKNDQRKKYIPACHRIRPDQRTM